MDVIENECFSGSDFKKKLGFHCLNKNCSQDIHAVSYLKKEASIRRNALLSERNLSFNIFVVSFNNPLCSKVKRFSFSECFRNMLQ